MEEWKFESIIYDINDTYKTISLTKILIRILFITNIFIIVLAIMVNIISSYKSKIRHHDDGINHKPAIYVYADNSSEKILQNYTIKLETNEKVLTLYPDANIQNNNYIWDVSVEKDKLGVTIDNETYPYLFWDAKTSLKEDFSEGFCIKGTDTKEFLEEKLEEIGLSDVEIHDFVVYWLPIMQQNEYNIIKFTGMDKNDDYNQQYKLSCVDENGNNVDKIFRINMQWKATDKYVNIKEQNLKKFERPQDEPYLVEWGGIIFND